MSVGHPSIFLLKVTGQIETGQLMDGDELYLQYFYHYGQDWKIERGIDEGVSQITRRSEDGRSIFVWNFPLDVTFKSTNPFGWPQIVIVLNGSDFLGKEIVRGYSACHLPISPGRHTKILKTFVPESASTLQKFVSWLSGSRPEFVNPKTIAQGSGREVTRVRSQGSVSVTFNVIMKDFCKLGYSCGFSSTLGSAKEFVSSFLRVNDAGSAKGSRPKKSYDEALPTTSRDVGDEYDDIDT